MGTEKDHPGVKLPPPAVFIGMGLLGGGIHFSVPLPIGLPYWSIYLGLVVMAASFVGLAAIISLFRKHETQIEPWKPSSTLITTGPYRFSRNPVYVIASGIPIGFGFIFNSYWALLSFIPALMVVYYTAVRKEEEYLERKFGQTYLDYKARVRRWL